MSHSKKTILSSALLLGVLACSNQPSTSAPAATERPKPVKAPKLAPRPSASTAPAESGAPARGKRPERMGPAGVLFAAAGELELPAEKKASLEKLDDGLGAGPADPEARKALHAAMTEGVKAGKIEQSKLEPALVLLDKAAAGRKEAEVKALDALHKELDAAQRKALVDAVKKKQAEREARLKERGKPDEVATDDKAKDSERLKRRVERLSQELGLDAEQQKKVEPILAKHDMGREGGKMGGGRDEMKKRVDALLVAFEKDGFSAAKLDFGADAKRHRENAKKRLEYVNALLSVIKPEQRDKLAATLDDAPGGRRGRGPGGPRPGRGRGFGGPPGAGDAPGDDHDD